MNFYTKLIVSLGICSGIASGLLAVTYTTTAPVIAQREIQDQADALQNVFFLQKDGANFSLKQEAIAEGVTALYKPENPDQPAYYAVTGSGFGYNSGIPVSLMVGFTGPAGKASDLLQGYVPSDRMPDGDGNYIVGFSVINSEETPGLGEKIKDARPP
jgi:Na+-translocating ferredoxin:NAD+ oxidoreductase RnfG subunit